MPDSHLVARWGGVGQNGNGGHAHNDLSSYELSGGDPIVVDSGTYLYTADLAARNAFRSATAHNVLVLDGLDMHPIPSEEPFRMPAHARFEVEQFSEAADRVVLTGSHDGFSRGDATVRCRRRISLQRATGEVEISDELTGSGVHTVDSLVHLAPDCTATGDGPAAVLVTSSSQRRRIEFTGAATVTIEQGWVSSEYGVRERAPLIRASITTRAAGHDHLPDRRAVRRRRRYDVCAAVISDLPFDARVWKESRSLAGAGYSIYLIGAAYDIEHPRRRRDESGVEVLEVPFGWRDRPKSYARRLWVLLRISLEVLRTPARVYHSHDIHVGPATWLASKLWRGKLVYDGHELWGEPYEPGLRWRLIAMVGALIERLMVHSSDVAITTNPSRADVLRRRYGREDITVLANVPPLERDVVALDPGYPAGKRVLLYQGWISPEARCFRETVQALPMVDDDIDFVILGFGWESAREMIRGWARETGVEDRVHFLPPRHFSELVSTAAAASVGLVPIRDGPLNHKLGDTNKLHEYLMGGLPVIASDLPEIRRVVTMGDPPVGELFDPSSPDSIARALATVLADPELLAARRCSARELAEHHLNWEIEEQRLLAAYERLLGSDR